MEFNNIENKFVNKPDTVNKQEVGNNKINTNSKEFLEKQLTELDNDFNKLYERMNRLRNLNTNK